MQLYDDDDNDEFHVVLGFLVCDLMVLSLLGQGDIPLSEWSALQWPSAPSHT